MVRTPQKRADEIFKIDRLLFISVRGVYCANKNRRKILIVLDASFKKMIPRVQKVNGVYSVKVHIVFSSSAPTVHLHLTAPSKELHLLLLYPCHSFSDAQALELLLCRVDTDTQFFIYKVYTCKPKSQSFYWLLGAYACKTNHL